MAERAGRGGEAPWAGAVFAAALAADLALRSKSFVFEGLARAMPIDVGRWRDLCPGNYLLYGPLGFCFHHLLALLGLRQPAVYSLQTMDALLGAGGLALYYGVLRRLGAARGAAAAWACVLGASLAWWLWSTDAQNYIFSAFLLMLAFRGLARRLSGEDVAPWKLGALGGLAVLGHVVNVLFAAPIAVCLWLTERRPRRARALGEAAGAFAAAAAAAYALALAVFVRPANWGAAAHWFLGSAAVGGGAAPRWHGGLSAASLGQWARMTLNVFVSFSPAFSRPPAPGWTPAVLWAARLALAALAAAGAWAGFRRRPGRLEPAAAKVCLAWLAAYALVFTSWEPWTMVYRVPDLIPLTTLLFLCARALRRETALGAGLAALLAAGNFGAELYPRSFSSNNDGLRRMQAVKAATREGDWVTGEGGQDELYIPYFAERNPLLLGRFEGRPEALSRFIEGQLAAGRGVYATSDALAQGSWAGYFSRFSLSPAGSDGEGFVVYRVGSAISRPRASRSRAASR